MKKYGLIFGVLVCAFCFFAACPQDSDDTAKTGGTHEDPVTPVEPVDPADLLDPSWLAVAVPFRLEGGSETSITNIKLSWSKRTDANRYEVWRDGVLAAKTTGVMLDDYALAPDTEYTYTLRSYLGSVLKAVSPPISIKTFTTAAGPVWVWDNLTGTRTYPNGAPPAGPGGWKFGDRYYDFRTSSVSGGIALQGRTSADGLSGWSSWTTLTGNGTTPATIGTYINPDGTEYSVAGVKLEGVGWHRVGDKVVLSAHREPAGSSYALGHFLLASFYPGETYAEYASWPGGAKAEVTFDGRPNGYESRDQSIYVDNDGTAYALCSGISNLTVHLLDDAWTEPIEYFNTFFAGQSRETPHIVQVGDMYYIYSSRQNGWYPTQTRYVTIPGGLNGPVSELKDVGSQGSYGSQFNRIEEYHAEKRESYGLWGFRWAANWDGDARESANIQRVVPVAMNGEFSAAEYVARAAWYADYGLVGIQSGRMLSIGAQVTVSSANADYPNSARITDGANNTVSGFFRGGEYPYNLVLDLGKPAAIAEITLSCNLAYGSDTGYLYTYEGSADAETWTLLKDGSANAKPGFLIDPVTDAGHYRYIRMTVNGLRDWRHSGNSATWADGIIELAVYGTPAAE